MLKLLLILTVLAINNSNGDGVTRVTCGIEGTPHTSDRIDSAVLSTGGRNYEATDIDGVDFQRYFQLEDEGVIQIDLDFPLCKNLSYNDSIVLKTVHGDVGAPLRSAVNHIK
ncbi:MAG: hypothetical protein J1E99_05435 [Muribaculaceae bacterium]|nr:hypothetical protein [Muribaculaceae bacterium]